MIILAGTVVGAVVVAVVQASFFSALPAPLSLVHMPLMLVLLLVINFRFREAFAAALASGAVLDLAFATSFGVNTMTLGLVTLALIPLFTHIFTNSSMAATIAINAAGYCLAGLVGGLVVAVSRSFGGYGPVWDLVSLRWLAIFLYGLTAHLAASVAVMTTVRSGKRLANSFFLVRRIS